MTDPIWCSPPCKPLRSAHILHRTDDKFNVCNQYYSLQLERRFHHHPAQWLRPQMSPFSASRRLPAFLWSMASSRRLVSAWWLAARLQTSRQRLVSARWLAARLQFPLCAQLQPPLSAQRWRRLVSAQWWRLVSAQRWRLVSAQWRRLVSA